jgi:ribosomal protein S18 acetylase RimI-like enzyme
VTPGSCGEKDGLTIQVVPITEEHIESFYRCLDAVARERKYLARVQAPPLESVRQFALKSIESAAIRLVALSQEENQARVVGWCDISPMAREGFTHRGRLGMGVHKDFRKRGIGTRLINEAIGKAKEKGLERIELEVFASNTPAIKLYEKAGFVVEGVKKKARKLDGVSDDMIQMALFI